MVLSLFDLALQEDDTTWFNELTDMCNRYKKEDEEKTDFVSAMKALTEGYRVYVKVDNCVMGYYTIHSSQDIPVSYITLGAWYIDHKFSNCVKRSDTSEKE